MFKRFAILALVCVSVVSAKTYNFTVTITAQAGNTQLKPGEYSVKVDGTQIVLKDNSGHRIDVAATLETAGQKFNETAVVITLAEGTNRIEWIQLGGSNTRVMFECPIERCNLEGSCRPATMSCGSLAGS
jgi:hypothetical protein